MYFFRYKQYFPNFFPAVSGVPAYRFGHPRPKSFVRLLGMILYTVELNDASVRGNMRPVGQDGDFQNILHVLKIVEKHVVQFKSVVHTGVVAHNGFKKRIFNGVSGFVVPFGNVLPVPVLVIGLRA